jgi:hypothetical protein
MTIGSVGLGFKFQGLPARLKNCQTPQYKHQDTNKSQITISKICFHPSTLNVEPLAQTWLGGMW